MDRFAAWSLGEPLNDPQGRYRLIYGGKPAACRPDATRFVHLSVQDATFPPSKWEPRKSWDWFIHDCNLWMRDKMGARIPGWGHGISARYIVDLGKKAPWDAAILIAQHHARETCGADGLHIDDLSIRCHWAKTCEGLYDPHLYEVNVDTIAYAMGTCRVGSRSASGWKQYYTPDWFIRPYYKHIKMEGFRFAPHYEHPGWGGPAEAPFTWESWFVGHKHPRCYGIMELEAWGLIPVLEAQYDPAWPPEMIEDYARIAVVTACLAIRCHVAVHADHVWTDPYWGQAHEQALALGEPTEHPKRSGKGTWHRTFEHGSVTMNPTDEEVAGVQPHSAQIAV